MVKQVNWTRDLVRRFWSAISETRLEDLSFSKYNGEKIIGALQEFLKAEHNYLDFGAGKGDFCRMMLDRGYKIGAYEVAEGREALIRESDQAGGASFLGIYGDNSAKSFDGVFVLDVIEHVLDEELKPTLQRLRDFVTRGGFLFLTTPNSEDLELGYAVCPMCEHSFHRWQHVRSFTKSSLVNLLEETGFQCVAVSEVDFSTCGDLAEELKHTEHRLRQSEEKCKELELAFTRGRVRAIWHIASNSPRQGKERRFSELPRKIVAEGGRHHLLYVGRRVQ